MSPGEYVIAQKGCICCPPGSEKLSIIQRLGGLSWVKCATCGMEGPKAYSVVEAGQRWQKLVNKISAPSASGQLREHILKTWPGYFQHLADGTKKFEIRKNDRGYKRGDVLELREWSKANGYSGRQISAEVTYIIYGETLGVAPGWCLMSINEVWRNFVK